MNIYPSTEALIAQTRPDVPMICFRPHRLAVAATWFGGVFPADAYYAVKANPSPHILMGLWQNGIRGFDVASLMEVERVRAVCPDAQLAFMHPVKSRRAIAAAYKEHGVRAFVLDSDAELQKIVEETGGADNLTLIVRLSVDNSGAVMPLAGKFGVGGGDAATLITATRQHAAKLGVSFHVGSQAMDPAAWRAALGDVAEVCAKAAAVPDIVNVGGGFPSVYPGLMPPPMMAYADAIAAGVRETTLPNDTRLWAEPGRALVAESESLLTRIDLAKPGRLYLNDGGFGALYDAVNVRWEFPIRALKADGSPVSQTLIPYRLHGPTCDPEDRWPEATMLPENLVEGDYLEFGNIGAYGSTMASRFNGFGDVQYAEVQDSPFDTLY